MHVHHCHCSYMTLNQSCCKKIFEYMCETTVGVFFFFFSAPTCLPSDKWERSNFLILFCVWHGLQGAI